jgi:phage-related protein
LAPLREILAKFGFDVDIETLQRAHASIAVVRGAVDAARAAFDAVGGAIMGAGRFVAGMAAAADASDKTARAIGITTRELEQWKALVQDSGGEAQQFEGGIKNLAKQFRDALKGGEDQVKTFRKLGVSLRDSSGRARSLGDVLEDSVLGLKNFENSAQRAAVADDLFAEAGQTLIRVSLDGADALRQQRERFDALNQGGRFDRFVDVSKENAAAFDGWRNASEALKRNLATALIPALTAMVKGATAVVEWFQRMSRGSRVLEVGFTLLATAITVAGVAFLAAFWYPLLIIGAVVAAVAAVVLIIDDLIALFSGGKSVIGAAIDELFGIGSAQAVVEALTWAFDKLTDGVTYLIEVAVEAGAAVAGALGDAFDWISERVGKLIDDARALAKMLAPEITEIWEAMLPVIEAVIARVSEIVDGVVEKVTGAIDYVTDLAGKAADLLGFGDEGGDGGGTPLAAVLGPAREAPVVDRRDAAGSTSVRVEQPVQVNVNGALDPSEVARRVREALDRSQVEQLENVREMLLGASS